MNGIIQKFIKVDRLIFFSTWIFGFLTTTPQGSRDLLPDSHTNKSSEIVFNPLVFQFSSLVLSKETINSEKSRLDNHHNQCIINNLT